MVCQYLEKDIVDLADVSQPLLSFSHYQTVCNGSKTFVITYGLPFELESVAGKLENENVFKLIPYLPCMIWLSFCQADDPDCQKLCGQHIVNAHKRALRKVGRH